jgi:hypothetical protein
MLKGFFLPTKAVNEPKGYAPNSPEKQPFKQLTLKCGILKSTPLYISEEIELGIPNDVSTTRPHRRNLPPAEKLHVEKAISNALESRTELGK